MNYLNVRIKMNEEKEHRLRIYCVTAGISVPRFLSDCVDKVLGDSHE